MANPLKIVGRPAPTRSAHEEADRMNAYGRGQIAGCKGEFIDRPRHDAHWVVRDGRCVIEWVDPPQGSMGR